MSSFLCVYVSFYFTKSLSFLLILLVWTHYVLFDDSSCSFVSLNMFVIHGTNEVNWAICLSLGRIIFVYGETNGFSLAIYFSCDRNAFQIDTYA